MYYERYADKLIPRALKSSGAVLVAGPKFCGKTTTSLRYQKSVLRLNTQQAISIAQMNPAATLNGETPRMIDEWQKVPDIWNYVKEDLDKEYVFGKYILTGSSTPADKTKIHHSGAGRITPIKMKSMTLFESGESTGEMSLIDLFEGKPISQIQMNEEHTLDDVAFYICRGGWPIAIGQEREIALDITRNYYNSLFIFEDSENEKFRNKKPEIMKMIVKSYARNISSEASKELIMADVRGNNERTLDSKTYDDYVEALNDIYILDDLEAWNPNIRSKTSIRQTPTRHFVDTSIGCRALNISPNDLMNDLNTMGLFFEDMAVRDLSVYAMAHQGEVRHYRDNTGLECDAVVHLEDGRWGAIEIKLGGDKLVEEGASSLKRLKNKIEQKSDEPSPSFLMVLTAVGPCYQRDDGVNVVPINMLKD
ncbi:MAG: ATP-binding protein [Lachnospiraceae bacterium]|nr:ATP-binding protein [Lachnospiraceae bacterium]